MVKYDQPAVSFAIFAPSRLCGEVFRIKEDFREGRVHLAGATVPPRPALVECGAKRTLFLQSRLHQVSGARIWALPLPPQDAAQLAPEPTVEVLQCPISLVEPLAQDLADTGQDTLACRLASDVDVAVIRIATERVATALQFPIQFRQQDVRQQRTERAGVRCRRCG